MSEVRPVLLVEDDRVDVMTVKRVFKELKLPNELQFAGNGLEALEHLRDKEKETPGLILLDLNMPKMNGIEFLSERKDDDFIKRIPVVVLTTSKEDQDKIDSYNFGVAGYMIKPVEYDRFVDIIKTVSAYWNMSEVPE
ncbi:MAG: response regulator [Thermodesulfobacteriota bacterium]